MYPLPFASYNLLNAATLVTFKAIRAKDPESVLKDFCMTLKADLQKQSLI